MKLSNVMDRTCTACIGSVRAAVCSRMLKTLESRIKGPWPDSHQTIHTTNPCMWTSSIYKYDEVRAVHVGMGDKIDAINHEIIKAYKSSQSISTMKSRLLSTRYYSTKSSRCVKSYMSKCNLVGGELQSRRFKKRSLSRAILSLFDGVVSAAQQAGIPVPQLSRGDLHHAHVVYNPEIDSIVFLFHAMEYPEFCSEEFPVNLGFCQSESNVPYDESRMAWRNFIWVHDTILCLNCSSNSPLSHYIIMDGLKDFATVLESDLGTLLFDVYLMPEELMPERKPEQRLFVP
eukprot:jgi/Picsp_1/4261/NSC_01770-R1_hypothetical protein CHLNCDRAFT_134769 [Chlorella variabilis]